MLALIFLVDYNAFKSYLVRILHQKSDGSEIGWFAFLLTIHVSPMSFNIVGIRTTVSLLVIKMKCNVIDFLLARSREN